MSRLEPRLAFAAHAVARAGKLCGRLRSSLTQDWVHEKADDAGPVTVADFAVQALVSSLLLDFEPGSPLVAEEAADDLVSVNGGAVCRAVQTALQGFLPGEISEPRLVEVVGRASGHSKFPESFWTLDPIDGTKGFLRGDQYAVALAWIEKGRVELAALACPSLAVRGMPGVWGLVLAARRGSGLWMSPLDASEDRNAWIERFEPVTHAWPSPHRFCESFESGHSDHALSSAIAAKLGINQPPLRMDSQAKYAAVALGEAAIYLRLPTRPGYEEKIWDHAAGKLCIEEAGGTTSDTRGLPLDFGQGVTLKRNRGIVASRGFDHARVLDAVNSAMADVQAQQQQQQ